MLSELTGLEAGKSILPGIPLRSFTKGGGPTMGPIFG